MNKDYQNELTPEVREKMNKNLVYVGIFSILMLFAGFTSAYIVSMGDSFWMKFDFPQAFYISTFIIILSSITLWIGTKSVKSNNGAALKWAVPTTLILGIAFAVFQFIGYFQLFDKGAHFVSNIIVTDGRYGDYFEVKIGDKYMEIDGNDYLIEGKVISEQEKSKISTYFSELDSISRDKNYSIKPSKYTLVYKGTNDILIKNNQFYLNDSTPITKVDLLRLESFSVHLRDKRGDFIHKGKYGKDFVIYYKGKKLDYKDRKLYYNNRVLTPPMQLDMERSADLSTTYLFIITALHLLHVLVTLIYLSKKTIHSFTGRLAENNFIGIRSGAIFWHFLGLLWVYLLCFLLFIH
jgi:cytochrome c oxidase subunit 3